ncbi:SI11A protein, partial [Polypterus senegalus]
MDFFFFLFLQVLDNFPVLLYILAAKTLILCLAFAGTKIYQSKKAEAALKRQQELKRKAESNQTEECKKDD